MASILWARYDTPASILTTQLNALAADATCAAGTAINNTAKRTYADVEFVAGAAFSPVAGGYVELWLLRSLDGGSTYEDGSNTVQPIRPADMPIMVRSGTSITPRCGASKLLLPPGFYKPILRNRTGVALPATGNLIRMAAYSESV